MTERSSRLRVGVIVDRQMLTRWQLSALRTLSDDADLVAYSCRSTRPSVRRFKFALYYLLNLFSIRNRMTKRQSWPADLPVAAMREFDAIEEGAWQRLPAEMIGQLQADRIDVLVKFGMGLLRVPDPMHFSIPILSYHHGDPAEFRGRPAGFYETLVGKPAMGQVIQRISNDLDAGDIVASAETKVAPHSYRTTLIEAYRHSPLILERAIGNAVAGRSWRPAVWGRNYLLPGNGLVMKFLILQLIEAAKRFWYGLFIEKRWQVATVGVPDTLTIKSLEQAISNEPSWQAIPTPKEYRFLADPFFHPAGGLLVEGMNVATCRGEILHAGDRGLRRASGRGGHYSYPATIDNYAVPEISDWSPAMAFPLGEEGLGEPLELKIPGRPALIDPTPFRGGDTLYLFANRADEGTSVLRLWTNSDLRGDFTEHPSSPIRLSPRGSRMAGSLLHIGGELYRVGQDLSGRYGDGLLFFRINRIDCYHYSEEAVHDLRFGHVRGPHTLNLGEGRAAFDYYIDRVAILAGVRRLRERRAARRIR
jgi:hypothetical protein